jgi:hypothetical protein
VPLNNPVYATSFIQTAHKAYKQEQSKRKEVSCKTAWVFVSIDQILSSPFKFHKGE